MFTVLMGDKVRSNCNQRVRLDATQASRFWVGKTECVQGR